MSRMAILPYRLISIAAALVLAGCVGTSGYARSEASIEDLWMESRGVRLGVTLYLPAGRPPYPAVVLVHGSGRMTASDVARGVAPTMNARGIAVLAYDKRGVGRSHGEYAGIGPGNSERMFDLLASDALAGVDMLAARSDIDKSRIGLFGFSQAGWIAPLAASRHEGVKFVVLVSGPAVTVGEENAYSDLAGADPGSKQGLSDAEIEREFAGFKGPHGFDPDRSVRAMRVPSLWLIGAVDRSIPVRRTVDNLQRIRREASRPITIQVLPGVDHGLRNPVTGERANFWPVVIEWLGRQRILIPPPATRPR